MEFRKGGSEYIRREIGFGIQNGTRRANIIGEWEIESAVRIPEDFTLILDNCHLKMADNTFDNMFINEHHDISEGDAPACVDRHIAIIGRGKAILDGGTYNGLSEKNSLKGGMPSISKNHLLFFTNVDGFEIRNISFYNMRYWAVNLTFCCNGEVTNLHFKANDTCIDPNGNVYHGLSVENYYDMVVKQADGIDIRRGCHHILIENITGFSGDDLVALTAINGKGNQRYALDGWSDAICYIKVKNVVGETLASNVRLLCQSRNGFPRSSLHHILVDGVEDTSGTTEHLKNHGKYGVHINTNHLYGDSLATEEEMHHITVRNVRSRADYAVGLAGNPVKNLTLENIVAFDGAGYIADLRGQELGTGPW